MIIQNLDFGDKFNWNKFKPVKPVYGRHESSNHIFSILHKYTKGPTSESIDKRFTVSGLEDYSVVYEYAIYESDVSECIWCNKGDLYVLEFIQDKIIDSFNVVYSLIDPFNVIQNKDRISHPIDGYEVIIHYREINKNTNMKKQEEKKSYAGTCVSLSEQIGFSTDNPWQGNDKQISETRFCRRELGTFKFITFYKEIDGTDKDVTVILTINYDKKNYSIDPGCGPKTFIFNESMVSVVSSKNKYPMWKAVLQSINDAIDFAEKELRQ